MKNPYQPYAYLIGWSHHNIWYYGVEYSKKRNAHPNNLWTKYFTSSKYVKEARKVYGEPNITQIRRTFETADAALLWEAKVLKRMNIIQDSKWLNKNIAGHFSTLESYPNPISGSTYLELYGDKGHEWKKNIGSGLKNFWKSERGIQAKTKKSLHEKNKVSEGKHIFQTDERFTKQNDCRIKEGTHNWLGPEANKKRIEQGTHNLLGPETNRKRLNEGTHNWGGMVPCIDKCGNFQSVTKDIFGSQTGNKEEWDFVHITSSVGKRRKLLKSHN